MKKHLSNLSHYHLYTANMGEIIPAAAIEIIPGDTIRMKTSMLLRCQPLVAPVLHPVQVRVHHFYCPYRILWDGFEDFIVGSWQGQVPNRTVPIADRLGDHFGIPPDQAHDEINEMPFRAYQTVYNEYFRDQEIQTEEAVGSTRLQYCGWEKDFASGARLRKQRGDDEAFALVDNNQVTATRMREALAQQRFLEARSRYGDRYTEYLQYLGITPSDARLNRPEYVGGGRSTISFSEVLQTVDDAEGAAQNPLGHMAGHGIAAVRSNRFERFFEEHGLLLTLVSVRPKAMYAEGLERKWRKIDFHDYWQKETQFHQQEPVYQYQVQSDPGTPSNETDVFGFAPRNYHLTSAPSYVSGEFRDTMDHWHLARKFQTAPNLDDQFIECNPSRRIFADQVADGLLVMANHSVQAKRLVVPNPTPRTI